MQKIFIGLVIMMSWLCAQNIMKVDSLQIAINDTAKVSINIENQDEFVGFQCDVLLPTSLTLWNMDLTERAVNHNLTFIDKGDNKYRVIVYSITNAPYNGQSGSVIDMYLISDTLPGEYQITLDSCVIGNASAENILTEVENGYVEIINITETNIDHGAYMPDDYQIKIMNYPNPFNTSTKLIYQLTQSGHVDINIYDTMGKKITTIFNGNQSSGEKELYWNANNYPSGIYYAQLITNETVSFCKLLFLK